MINKFEDKVKLITDKLMKVEAITTIGAEITEDEGNYPRDFSLDIWDWTQGVGIYGLYQAVELFQMDNIDFIKEWYNQFEYNEIIKNINTCAPMLTHLKISNDRVIQDEWRDWIINELPRTKYGCFQHTSSNVQGTGINLNDGQIWADTLFMTVLYLFEYGQKYNDKKAIDEAIYQVLMHVQFLYDEEKELFYHGYNFLENNHFGAIHWLRANGWIVYALVHILEKYENKDDAIYMYLKEIFTESITKIISYKNENNLYNTIIDIDSYSEISGTCLIVTAILKGINIKILDDKIDSSLDKTIEIITQNINDDGSVDNVSAGTTIGYDADHYKNIAITDMPYGKSIALLMLVEYKRRCDLLS